MVQKDDSRTPKAFGNERVQRYGWSVNGKNEAVDDPDIGFIISQIDELQVRR